MPPLTLCQKRHIFTKNDRNSEMTKAIYMAVELDQDIMVTNMCVKFGKNPTNSFQELDHTKIRDVRTDGRTDVQTHGRTDKGNSICPHFVGGINSQETMKQKDESDFSSKVFKRKENEKEWPSSQWFQSQILLL
jgi:hypothetical protein